MSAVQGEGPLYDASAVAPDRRKQLFGDFKRRFSWDVYVLGYLALAAYLVCATCAWRHLVAGGSLLWCVPYGWAVYCVWMVGHEAYHHTMCPSAYINEWLGYLTMDCVVNSRSTWKLWHHHVHHGLTLADDPQDRQRLFGPCVLVETANIIYTVLGYWWYDFACLWRAPTLGKAVAICVKYYILLRLPLNALVGSILSLSVMANYMALLSHAAEVTQPTADGVVRQLRTGLCLFPSSLLCMFITGALNNHAVHHIFPALPRALHPAGAAKLARLYPNEYRAVDDFRTLGALWVARHESFPRPFKMKDLPSKLPASLWIKQLSLDVASVAILVGVTAAGPAMRLL